MELEVWTKEEVAGLLKVKEEVIDQLVQDNKIPHFRLLEHVRFRKEEIIMWIERESRIHENGRNPKKVFSKGRPAILHGRNQWRISKDGETLLVFLNQPHTALTYSLIPLSEEIRSFFPGYKEYFCIETDAGNIETRVTSAPRGAVVGAPREGKYIQGGLSEWYRNRRNEIEHGSCLRIRQVEKRKRYRLDLIPMDEAQAENI